MKKNYFFRAYADILNIVPSKKKYCLKFIFFLIGSLLDLLTISLIPILINKLLLNENNSVNFYNIIYFDKLNPEYALSFFILIFIIKIFIYILIYYDFINYSYSFKNLIIIKVFNNILHSKKSQKNSKDRYLNLIRVVETFINSVLIPSFNIAFEIIIISIIFIFLCFWNLKITILIFTTLTIISLLYLKFLQKVLKRLGWLGIKLNEEIVEYLNYAIIGFREIILNRKVKLFESTVLEKLLKLKRILVNYDLINIVPRLSFELIIIIIFCALFLTKNFSIKTFIIDSSVYFYAFLKIAPSLIKIINLSNAINFGQYSSKIIRGELNKKNDNDYNNLKTNVFYKCIIKNLSVKTNENFQIKYPNFKIEYADKILITGQSGKGKSTLLDLICGFKKPNSGSIKFFNKKNMLIKPSNLINYCPQDILVLKDNLTNNLLLKFNKYHGKKLHFKDSVIKFAKNIYKSKNIINLSEGEKKRIGLIRVLNSNSQILIFDEPTSNLDKKNTRIFFNQLKNLKNKTVIIVTHNENYKNLFNKIIKI